MVNIKNALIFRCAKGQLICLVNKNAGNANVSGVSKSDVDPV
jgi:hypothetical protein